MSAAARKYEDEGHLSRFSLDRRITILVLFLVVLVVGAAAFSRIPVELIPSGFEEPFLFAYAPWENAPPREVLDKVTLPLEEELATVRGLDSTITISRVGVGIVYMWFKHGTDMDIAYREVRDRVERARPRFPADLDRVYVKKDDVSGFPVYFLGVSIDPSVHDAYNLIQKRIVEPLSRIDGVASVSVEGLVEKEILIELDREKTAAAGLNIWELAQDLGSDNFTLASGTVREGSRKLLLRSMARFDSLEALESRLVAPSIRLRDIARVSYEQPDRNFRLRAMSRPAVAVAVLKEGEANIKQVSEAVGQTVERIKLDPRLSGLGLMTLMSQGDIIDESLAKLLQSGAVGGVIALLVLLFFLRRIRLTIILALAIPLSLLIGLTAMYFGGESLNLLTLLGLMICVGLLVDNSVVVAENIHRLHRGGLDRRKACIRGAGEVGLAITMSTMTTIVVFLPVALVDGPAQFFLLRLALPVCISVAASLVVALVFIPLCVYLTLPTNGKSGQPGLWKRAHDRWAAATRTAYEKTFGSLSELYGRLLAFFLRRRLDLVLVLAIVFAVTAAIPMQNTTMVEIQEEERSGFEIDVEMPVTHTLEETEEWFIAAEKVIEDHKEEFGLEGWFHFHRKRSGEIQGWFTSPRTSDLTATEVTEKVIELLPRSPGMEIRVNDREEGRNLEDSSTYSIIVRGEDPELLEQVKGDLESFFVGVDGVLGVQGSGDPPPNELGLVVDRDRTQRFGVSPQAVAGVVGAALRGMELPKYHDQGKEIPVRVRFQEQDRESLAELNDFMVPTMDGSVMPLSSLTDTRFLQVPESIFRRDKQISRVITLELDEEEKKETRERLAAIQAGIDLPEGVSFAANVQQTNLDDDLASLRFALVLSVVFIYLLMGFLFESFILPVSIILTIPLSIIGVYWTHFAMGKDIDFLGFVAMVLLVGVVVNNGIVLIDYVNRLRNKGYDRQAALLTATGRRFRPIMMTAITTVGGLIPLAFAGSTSIGISYTSFALTLIGGMTTATLLTLLVVPVFYTFFDDAREAFALALRRAVGTSPESGIQGQPSIPSPTLLK